MNTAGTNVASRSGVRADLAGLVAEAMAWLRQHDPGLAALRRAGRAAVCMPAAFALGIKVLENPNVAVFCAFGSIALILLVEFRGSMADRVRAQAALAIAGAALVCLGTLASQSEALAAIAMGVVGAVVLFSGVISSVLASASVSLLLAFILPVSLGGPVSGIPDRLAGWGIASGLSLLAIRFLWPLPVQMPLRGATIAAMRGFAARLRVDAGAGTNPQAAEAERQAAAELQTATFATLTRLFNATPYRPTGLSTASRALVRSIDELHQLSDVLADTRSASVGELASAQLSRVHASAADALAACADLLADPGSSPVVLQESLDKLTQAMDALRDELTKSAPAVADDRDGESLEAALSSYQSQLEPGFHGLEVAFLSTQIATTIQIAVAAERRSWLDRLAGREPGGPQGLLASAMARARAHLNRHSVWLHNSLRGGIALGLAVLVGELLKVEHSFWIVLGTLSVLRSNASNTGQSTAKALLGTVVGFVVGGSLVQLVGANETALWLLLPPALLLAGFSPVAVSFAAGQASFTFTLLILFNIFAPAGWHVGVVRVEDVAIGGATSLLVGLLFWPRGAGAELRTALSDAYTQTADYLTSAVAYATSCCDGQAPRSPAPTSQSNRATDAARRLDDAFRSFVAERGGKQLPLAQASVLVNGPAALRVATEGILALWRGVPPTDASRTQATRELMRRADALDGWYRGLAAALNGERPVPEPAPSPQSDAHALLETVEPDLRDASPTAGEAAVRIIWTGDYLDVARRLQPAIAAAAGRVTPRAVESAPPASR